ncbi:hypothetical protein G9P44_002051 [Scheffersomyces stipitis]|nr:hypothetical protein G9P44_002051 [Scheffersomyces stipitis]
MNQQDPTEVPKPNEFIINLAKILNINEIDESSLQLCIKMIDHGVDPKQLAQKILEINSETKSVLD